MKASVQLKKGLYYVVISFKDNLGKHKTKWVPTGLKEGAGKRKIEEKRKEILSEFEEAYNRILYAHVPDENGITLSMRYKFTDFMDMWLETVKPTIALTTYKGYAKNIRRINVYFKDYNLMLHEVKPLHIQSFYNRLYQEGLSSNSIIHIHNNLHKAFSYALKNELILANPMDKVDRSKYKKYVATFYNKDELNKLLEVFKGDKMELCIHIAVYYGLRRSEILGLKWDAVDFENKTITIKHKIVNDYQNGTEVVIGEDKLKNNSSRRTLPLIPHIEAMLRAEKDKQVYYANLLRSGYDTKYSDYICRDNFGKLITPNFVTWHFSYMIKKHNLKPIRFHDLRHSCASLLLANGASMKEIQEWLGHSTYNVTANFYSHLDYNSKLASANAITKALESENDSED
jgi:integrase